LVRKADRARSTGQGCQLPASGAERSKIAPVIKILQDRGYLQMSATVTSIFIAPAAGAPMTLIETAELEAGRGIVGDRYYRSEGSYSAKLRAKGADDWQITLIESEEIDQFLADEGLDLAYGDFRRNIVTTGVRLNPLVGKRFVVAGVEMEGVRFCEPCAYLAKLLTDKLMPAMVGRCGLRARIVNNGKIAVGGAIEVQPL